MPDNVLNGTGILQTFINRQNFSNINIYLLTGRIRNKWKSTLLQIKKNYFPFPAKILKEREKWSVYSNIDYLPQMAVHAEFRSLRLSWKVLWYLELCFWKYAVKYYKRIPLCFIFEIRENPLVRNETNKMRNTDLFRSFKG